MTARALLLGERIDTAGLERPDLVSTAPLAFHTGQSGFVVLYKFGVAVLFGLSPLEEDEVLSASRRARRGGGLAGMTTRRWCWSLAESEDKPSPTGTSRSRTYPARAFCHCRRAGEKRGAGARRTAG